MNVKSVARPIAFLILVLSLGVPAQPSNSPPAQLLSPLLHAAAALPDQVRGPGRDRWQMPNEILTALDLRKGDVVADIGAGIGYFTMRFAQAVGPRGKVYAVDIDAHALEYLEKEARKQNLSNIKTIVSREDDPSLPAGSVSVAFFCDTVHEISDRVNFYRKVREALKTKGRMAVIDLISPAPKQGPASHESEGPVSRDLTVREAEQAGFRLAKEPKFLSRQYFLVFEKEPTGFQSRDKPQGVPQ